MVYVQEFLFKMSLSLNVWLVLYCMIVGCTGGNTAFHKRAERVNIKMPSLLVMFNHFLCIFFLFTCIDERQLALFELLWFLPTNLLEYITKILIILKPHDFTGKVHKESMIPRSTSSMNRTCVFFFNQLHSSTTDSQTGTKREDWLQVSSG